MTAFLQFRFDRSDLAALLNEDPDFIIVSAGYELVDDTSGTKRAALTATAECFKSGNPLPLEKRTGCPTPPCSGN